MNSLGLILTVPKSLAAQDKWTTESFKIYSFNPTTNLNLLLALVPNSNCYVTMKVCGKALFLQLIHFSYLREQSENQRIFHN